MPIYYGNTKITSTSFKKGYFGNDLFYQETPPNPLKLTASEDNSSIAYAITGSLPSIHIQVSTDNSTWTDWDGSAIMLNSGEFRYVKNTYNRLSTSYDNNYFSFVLTGSINVSGECNSMINYNEVGNYCFSRLFNNCTALKDANKLELSSMTLKSFCYSYMFTGCTSLVSAPELPATILSASACYYNMFNGCSSLRVSQDTGDHIIFNCQGSLGVFAVSNMFSSTGGSFKGTPTTGYTYYYNDLSYTITRNLTNCSILEDTSKIKPGETINLTLQVTGVYTLPNTITVTGASHTYDPITGIIVLSNAIDNVVITAEGRELVPLKLTASENGSSIAYSITGSLPNIHIQVSSDNSVWNDWDGSAITLDNGEFRYVRNTYDRLSTSPSNYLQFTLTGKISASGNCNSLLNYKEVSYCCFYYLFYECTGLIDAGELELPSTKMELQCYYSMFNRCSSLINPPELPATELEEQCYYYMFIRCTSLIAAPLLPATTLANRCYFGMFQNCASLTTVPDLPAFEMTTTTTYCCASMFRNCTSLINAPKLPATVLKWFCYENMFNGCTSLIEAPELPATELDNGVYSNMFNGCTSLTVIPELPVATNFGIGRYSSMFNGCSSLKVSEDSGDYYFFTCPDTSGMTNPVSNMFSLTGGTFKGTPTTGHTYYYNDTFINPLKLTASENNSSIAYSVTGSLPNIRIKISSDNDTWTDWDGTPIMLNNGEFRYVRNAYNQLSASTSNYFSFVLTGSISASGNCNSMINYKEASTYCFNRLFYNCAVLKDIYGLELPSTTLASYCYANMFSNCTSLTTAPNLPATKLVRYCYQYMFQGCTSIMIAPSLSATQLADSCYSYIFSNCTSLTTAPNLPATELVSQCYFYMFQGCTSLTTAPNLPVTQLATTCYAGMFQNCASLTTAPELPATELVTQCYAYMFQGCSSLKISEDTGDHAFFTCPDTTGLTSPVSSMFLSTGGSFKSSPTTGHTYYYNDLNYTITRNLTNCSILEDTSKIKPDETVNLTLQVTTGFMLPSNITVTGANYTYDSTTGIIVLSNAIDNVVITAVGESANPLKLTATEDGSSIAYAITGSLPNIHIQVSSDKTTWTDWDGSAILLNSGEFRYVKNTYNRLSTSSSNYFSFVLTGSISASGECNSMIYYNEVSNYCFSNLFKDCVSLKDISNLLLPSMVMEVACYESMFYRCTSLVSALELPSTQLANNCYYKMFQDCTSLTTAPELPAIRLVSGCYNSMFYGCTSLTTAPELPATRLAMTCYSYMFQGCTSLTTAPELPATQLETQCYACMFQRCTSLTTAPELPATQLANGCYYSMFQSCKSLTTAPKLPATQLETQCYGAMFYGCTSLTTAPELSATQLADICCQMMFDGCTSLTTAPELPATQLAVSCYSSMFGGCTSLTTAPELPATQLAGSCYSGMFSGCTSLVNAPELPATQLAVSCYSSMFDGCTSLTTTIDLPVTELENNCYNGMFSGCASLITVPELPATTLAMGCYQSMFKNCHSIIIAPELPATVLVEKCYRDMFWFCDNLKTAPQLLATELKDGCYEEMFYGCSSLKVSADSGDHLIFTCPDTTGTTTPVTLMFTGTGGTFKGTPTTGHTYYYND